MLQVIMLCRQNLRFQVFFRNQRKLVSYVLATRSGLLLHPLLSIPMKVRQYLRVINVL